MKAHISVLVMVMVTALAACGGGDDDGGADAPAVDSSLPAELTGEDILDKLLEVDGDGSGLDSDTIDGLDGADLARAGRRTITIQHDHVPAWDDLPEAGGGGLTFRQYIPPDIVEGEPIDLVIIGHMFSGTPCGIRLSAGATPYRHGEILTSVEGEINGAATPTTVTINDAEPFEIEATFEGAAFVPGNWGLFGIGRDHDHAQDTCTADFDLIGVALEYSAR